MGRSQRHKVLIQGTDSTGKGLSEKQPAIVYIRQFAASQAFAVPVGAPGGPLQGSTIAGFPPTLIPAPGALSERDGELREGDGRVGGDFTDPGQFNFSGNPIYMDLPDAGEGSGIPPEPEEPPVEPSLAPDQTLPEPEVPPVEPPPEEPPVEELATPVGPLLILRVERVGSGLAVSFDGEVSVRPGYHVTIEATGNTSVNGTYEVLSVDGNSVVIDSTTELAAPIESKGRITITGTA